MQREGPILESLTRRLAETPEAFLDEPRIQNRGRIHVAAVVNDLLRLLGGSLGGSADANQLAPFLGEDVRRDRNRLAIALVGCWLLADDWFVQHRIEASEVLAMLHQVSGELEGQVAARKFVSDPDRREELARVALARLGYRPAGETLAQAQDRLATLNSAERARVMKAAQEAERRARQIREALARKAAEESADKFTRE